MQKYCFVIICRIQLFIAKVQYINYSTKLFKKYSYTGQELQNWKH